ncbi:hypothetical protein GCM10010168_70860 [Actinoplanes ianthinogenes]|uniref:GGDEF domain-containing protein n=1 Tax=Actinoplanes ianthinogenes TaxID=122358 RepID=A0ABM7M6Q1_9ACTN|nr:hypothetical protein Aiant_79820 [Actinoplanes ianthinogenes]GGR42007.1 hypothetical protein GCM10010168_70860 [Actinoplanes ianthinogenes]
MPLSAGATGPAQAVAVAYPVMDLVLVTVSVGVACLPDDVAELTRIADQALYAAKAAGRNRVVVAGAGPLPAAA